MRDGGGARRVTPGSPHRTAPHRTHGPPRRAVKLYVGMSAVQEERDRVVLSAAHQEHVQKATEEKLNDFNFDTAGVSHMGRLPFPLCPRVCLIHLP